MNRFSFELPFFPGFYESTLYDSDTEYWAIKQEVEYYTRDLREEHPEYQGITEDDLEFDYKAYEKDVMDAFIVAFKDNAPGIVKSVEFDELVSPKYYNFSTDRLFCWVTFSDDWKTVMREFMDDNYALLKDHIREAWSSRDGFWSFTSNDVDEWYGKIFDEEDPMYIGIMLGYMMRFIDGRDHLGEVSDTIIMDTLEDIYDGFYVHITEEAQDRINQGIQDGTIKTYDPAQLTIPFED